MRRFVLFVVFFVAGTARSDVQVGLRFEPRTVQAGIPASVVLTLTNNGPVLATVSASVALLGETADGTPFVVTDGMRRVRQLPNGPVTLAPHETVAVRWDSDDPSSPHGSASRGSAYPERTARCRKSETEARNTKIRISFVV
jgi:hypothetical protein